MIIFDDGKPMDGNGPWRLEVRSEGKYVLGCGQIIPVATYEEGIEEIRKHDSDADIVKRYDLEETRRKAAFFYKGRRYKIVKAGGSIRGYTDKKVFWSHILEVGAVVTYDCYAFYKEPNWSYRSFSVIKEDSKLQGFFWPQDLMCIDTSFFEKLEE